MFLNFKYDLQKDVENFLKSFTSVNNKTPTELQVLYASQYGEVEVLKVSEFLQKQAIDVPHKLEQIEFDWKAIELQVIERMEKLFNFSLDSEITVYLSTNSRCTYNIEENYFFIYMDSKRANTILAHELLHFYTWHALYKELIDKGIAPGRYNDIKESLTELLNTDFQDLLGPESDKGYSQHFEIRKKVNQLRKEGKAIQEIVDQL